MHYARRAAFTLIEVLIVVVIMSILAAVILPQVSSSTNDAKEAQLKHHLHLLRSQIELYRTQHLGELPVEHQLQADFHRPILPLERLGPHSRRATIRFGPYLSAIPTQPFSGSTRRHECCGWRTADLRCRAGRLVGFTRPSTGQVWVNHADYATW